MKRYNNLSFIAIVFIPISCIGYLLGIILGCVFYDGDLIGTVIMCITLACVIFISILTLLLLRNTAFIVTYYDDEKILQKSLCKRKQIKYEDIKEIYISGSYIYLTSKEYNLKFDEKEKRFQLQRKVNKLLKHEVAIMITSEALFLKYINLEKTQVYVLKNSIKITVDKYFK
ncbi:MAG: hypothetical protein K2I88_01655 [Anaeroplasmataceae bacterium]|nr:hypothetical protein [Anaeroplasmataceae bacterium]